MGNIWGLFGYCLLLKTKNWKYYSKIIFKCVNSTMGPSFKVVFMKKKKKKKVHASPLNSALDPLKTLDAQNSKHYTLSKWIPVIRVSEILGCLSIWGRYGWVLGFLCMMYKMFPWMSICEDQARPCRTRQLLHSIGSWWRCVCQLLQWRHPLKALLVY